MGRQGPCFHCGIDWTPLWRCGPPEKPVLCNACGSRYRKNLPLKNYIPKHGIDPSFIADLDADDELDCFRQGARQGPCCHCGIDRNRLWRCGPPEKPVLCNACGLRWRTRKTLEDYVPKHVLNPSLARDDDDNNDDYKEELDGLNVKSSSHRHDTVDLDQVLKSVVRKKRTAMEHKGPSTAEILHQKLRDALQDPELSKDLEDYEAPENALIPEKTTYYISANEVGVGCELIKPTN